MNENLSGLSAREVEERRARGEGGTGAAKITKTKPQIVRENLCTLFNFLNFLIAVLLFLVGVRASSLSPGSGRSKRNLPFLTLSDKINTP